MHSNALLICKWMHSRYANERTPGGRQRTSGMLMSTLPAHCNALQRTPDMLMNALLTYSSALYICKWAHSQWSSSFKQFHQHSNVLLPAQMLTSNLTFSALGAHSNPLVTRCKYTHSNALLFREGPLVAAGLKLNSSPASVLYMPWVYL